MPFLVSAASWNPTAHDLNTWLIDQLISHYPNLAATAGSGAGHTRARLLLESGFILPILDGLDEIPPAIRGQAIAHINSSLRPGSRLVVTCRTAEFREAIHQASGPEILLAGAGAIELRPLDPAAVAQYQLISAGGPANSARWEPVTAALGTQGPVAQALSSPLMVHLANVIYNPRPSETDRMPPDPAELCAFPTRQAIEAHLLGAFIRAAYRGHPDPSHPSRRYRWTAGQAERWLVFLAKYLESRSTTDLAWWELRYLTSGPLIQLGVGMLAGLAAGLLGSLTAGLTTGLIVGAAAGSTVAFVAIQPE